MIRQRRIVLGAAATAAAMLLAAGCGSSKSGGTPGGGDQAAKQTITVGVLADLTGAAASGNKTVVDGVKAGTVYASRNGYTIKYIVADTATNPTTALAAAQKLVTQDHVFAVIGQSALFFAAAPYLTAHNVPVVGISEDGPEWATSKNMFSVIGALQNTKVAETTGKQLKLLGVTNFATLGYSVSPSSSEAASSNAVSAETAGIKVGYLNAKFPFGSTDVTTEVLAMKKAGINGFMATVDPNTAFALIQGLRTQGVNLKAALLPTGYGGDLFQAGPGALQEAQGVYFTLGFEPVEMQTAATKQFVSDLTSAGIKTEPTFASYIGYTSIGLLVQALQTAGKSATPASVLTALSGIHKFTAMGLFGTHSLDINDRENIVQGADNCSWLVRLEGSAFKLVDGGEPICGAVIPGKTVKPAT
ncbi:ABC transporter substrate-binding protein [Pseudofrankia inefficax]|uniref:Extracellular ligand-binding receptor n=1 Tax=Pseudofrankia inefficax (strain DSM 45817 / CECT 9037 / DDB 130130 / EuI1c) TaxID=298654 RepID=E3IZS2_PSEI1|nr:ABC transporter substrate-binding protein [Pseudofrankia inefficax]ADP83990.1 Extracellular ligand-binding receptor [Pseudofrankia inefficax]